jgi:hypothetical protein
MVNRNPLSSAVRAATALLIVPLALLAAGCGGSSNSAGTTATTTTSATAPSGASGGGPGRQTAALAAFQTCLKQHGIKATGGFGGPPGGAGGSPPPNTGQGGAPPAGASGRGGAFPGNLTAAQQKAFTACRAKLPAGTGGFGPSGQRGPGQNANPAFAKYTKCLGQHGVKFGSTNGNTAAFKKASAACAKYLPTGTSGN